MTKSSLSSGWKQRLPLLLLLAFAGFRIALFLGNFDIQVSRSSTDAGPVAIGHYAHAPDEFSQDAEMRMGYRMWLASMMHSMTVLLYEVFGVAPEATALVLVYAQYVLLGWAMYSLSLVLGVTAWAAALTGLYVLSFDPQFFNLANYGGLMWMPYAGHLALPFLLFSFAALVSDRWKACLALLLTGGLVHSVLGVHAAGIAGLYVLFRHGWKPRAALPELAWLGACVLLMLLPSRLVLVGIDRLSSQEMYGLISSVWHQVPWLAGALFTDKIIWLLAKVAVASAVVFWAIPKSSANARLLWISVLLGSFLLAASNVLGVVLQSTELLQLSGFRATTFVILLSLPFFFQGVLDRVAAPGPRDRGTLAMGVVVVVTALIAIKVFRPLGWDREMAVISALVLADVFWRRFLPALLAWPRLLLIGVVTAVAVNEGIRGISIAAPDFQVSDRRAMALTLLILLLGWAVHWGLKRNIALQASAPILAASIGIASIASAQAHGSSTTTGSWERIYLAQKWALESTKPGSSFILMDQLSPFQSWRSISRRPMITQFPLISSQYFYSREMIRYADRLSRFYGLPIGKGYFLYNADGENLSRKEMFAAFRGLSEDRIVDFSREFGGDYLVRKSGEPGMRFPVAYRNNSVVIYDLRAGTPSTK